jgi:CelD/BcsL family acetyltransferase involved in cellulose biosynthesis
MPCTLEKHSFGEYSATGEFLPTLSIVHDIREKSQKMRNHDALSNWVPAVADVIEINGLDQLQSYRMVWNNLFRQTARASFFHTFDWLCTYWRHFGHDQRMRVLVVRASGTPIGLLPLVVRTEPFRAGALRILTYPIHDWGTWYGPIGPNPSATMFMAMQHIHDTARDWDLMELRWTDAQRSDRSTTLRAMRAAGFRPRGSGHHHVSTIQFDGDWESYLAGKKSKWRSELKRQIRTIEKCGPIGFVRYRPRGAAYGEGDPRWDLFDACRQISQHSWQGSSKTGTTLNHDQIRNYLQETHADAARLGMLDLTMLTVDAQPAAFTYNYHFNGHIYGLRMGYDSAISNHGLGNVLMARTLEDSFKRGDISHDLGPGDNKFKRMFRTGVESSSQFSHYPWMALRCQAVRFSRWIKRKRGIGQENTTTGKGSARLEPAPTESIRQEHSEYHPLQRSM